MLSSDSARRRPYTVVEPAPARPRMQRLGSSERFFVSLRKVAPTNLARVIAFEGVLPAQRLAWALRRLQVRHPLLRSHVDPQRFLRWTSEHAPALALRSEPRRDDLHWQRALERLLDTRLSTPLELHYLVGEFGQRSELIIVADHAISDGMSINSLCAELLALCSQATLRGPRELRPVLDDMLPAYSRAQRAQAFADTLLRMGLVVLQRGGRAQSVQGSAHAYRVLSEADTTALLARARSAQTTVTGALIAAIAQALDRQRLAVSIPVNLRPHLPDHELSAEDLGNFTSAAYFSADARADFWSNARSLKRQLAHAVAPDRLLAASSLIYRPGSLFVRRRRALADAMISNSSLVPLTHDYGAFRVLAFYSGTSAHMLSADYAFFCNTFEGRLTINLVYTPQLVTRVQAEQVLDRVHALLEAKS